MPYILISIYGKKTVFMKFLCLVAFFMLAVVLIAAAVFLPEIERNKSADLQMSMEKATDSKQDLEVQPPKTPDVEAELLGEVKLLFVGDIMFDRYIRQVAEKRGYDFIFEGTDSLLEDKNLAIGNLEGPITDNQSRNKYTEFGTRENLTFTFAPETAAVLNNHNIKLANLGNNHILNFGENGLEQTKKYLDEAGVRYFCDKDMHYTLYKIHDTTLGFVCFNQFEADAVEKTLKDIGEIKGKTDIIILYAHWGKEYETSILPIIKMSAHQFVDEGVDLIIGSHPHIVQEKEEYSGKFIYYSLGNFIFDQYFDPNAAKGLAVRVIISPGGNMQFTEYQLQMKANGQTVLLTAK